MGVDAGGCREHRAFRLHADSPQLSNVAALRGRVGELLQVRLDRRRARAKRADIHVVMAAVIDMADETGFWKRLEFKEKAIGSNVANRAGIAVCLHLRRNGK